MIMDFLLGVGVGIVLFGLTALGYKKYKKNKNEMISFGEYNKYKK